MTAEPAQVVWTSTDDGTVGSDPTTGIRYLIVAGPFGAHHIVASEPFATRMSHQEAVALVEHYTATGEFLPADAQQSSASFAAACVNAITRT